LLQALVQRVLSAEIEIQDQLHARIESGLLAFICFEPADSIQTLDSFIKKIENFYFFDDDSNVMSTSLKEIDAELMIVSQFTLSGITSKGNKPSFHKAAPPALALTLYNKLMQKLDSSSIKYQSGVFGAHMDVTLTNTGPVTFPLYF